MKALIVGLGSIGQRHLANLRQLLPQARIGVFRSGASGVTALPPTGADDLFYDIDSAAAFAPEIALVCNPSTFHVPVARKLVAAGAHLFIEKPLAADLSGVDELLAATRDARRVLFGAYNMVFLPSLVFIRDTIRTGRLGRVLSVRAEVGQYLPDWRPATDYRQGASARRDLGGGVLLELSHELHYLNWLFGSVISVQSTVVRTGELESEVEDLAELVLKFRDGPIASVHLDFLQRSYSRSCKIIGAAGTLVWEAAGQRVLFYSQADRDGTLLFEAPAADRNEVYLKELGHFLECVSGRAQPKVDGAQAREVLRIISAAWESSQTGRIVQI